MLAKKIALGFGIAIIFPMMIHYCVATFSPRPSRKELQEYYKSYGKSQESLDIKASMKEFEDKRTRFDKHLLFVSVPLGIIAIISGLYLTIQAIGTGLMFGGIFSVCNGYFHYWTKLSDTLKFISLIIAFIVLIIVGYKKLDKN